MARKDEWPDIVRLSRSYCLRKYGTLPVSISFQFAMGGEHREPVFPGPLQGEEEEEEPSGVSGWASGPEPKHLPDWRTVYWPGLGTFQLSQKQATVVKRLWEALMDGEHPDVDQKELLALADSESTRLRDLFKVSSAWGRLVVQGSRPGTYRLPDPPPASMGERESA